MSSLKESLLEVIKANYYDVIQTDTVGVYFYPNIPSNILNGARSSYVSKESKNDILCIMDTTVFSTGKTGMAFTVNGNYYYSGMFGDIYFSKYDKYLPVDSIYFNTTGYRNLINKINSAISSYNFDSAVDTIGGIVNGISDLIKAFSEELQDDVVDLDHSKNKLENFSKAFEVTYDDIRKSPGHFFNLLSAYIFMCSEALGYDPNDELSELGLTEEETSIFYEWFKEFTENRITYPYIVCLDNIIKTDENEVGLEDVIESFKDRFDTIMHECDFENNKSIILAEKETYKAVQQFKEQLKIANDMLS